MARPPEESTRSVRSLRVACWPLIINSVNGPVVGGPLRPGAATLIPEHTHSPSLTTADTKRSLTCFVNAFFKARQPGKAVTASLREPEFDHFLPPVRLRTQQRPGTVWQEGQRACFLRTHHVPRPAHRQLLPKLNPALFCPGKGESGWHRAGLGRRGPISGMNSWRTKASNQSPGEAFSASVNIGWKKVSRPLRKVCKSAGVY